MLAARREQSAALLTVPDITHPATLRVTGGQELPPAVPDFASAEHGADPHGKLAPREGLGHIAIGAKLKPDRLVDLSPWRSA